MNVWALEVSIQWKIDQVDVSNIGHGFLMGELTMDSCALVSFLRPWFNEGPIDLISLIPRLFIWWVPFPIQGVQNVSVGFNFQAFYCSFAIQHLDFISMPLYHSFFFCFFNSKISFIILSTNKTSPYCEGEYLDQVFALNQWSSSMFWRFLFSIVTCVEPSYFTCMMLTAVWDILKMIIQFYVYCRHQAPCNLGSFSRWYSHD